MSSFATPFGYAHERALQHPFAIPDRMKHVAPERGNDQTREIKCAPFLDVEQLSPTQRADLAIGTAATEAVWKAVQADPFWVRNGEWPMRRCIFTALTVRDTLHAVGRTDAIVTPVGMKLVQTLGTKKVNVITIGCPGSPIRHNCWPAHMVVRLGDIVLDPTCGQTQRFWNAAPDAAALMFEPKSGRKVELEDWGKANVRAQHCYGHAEFDYCVTYFELTRSIARRIGYWVNTGDANPWRRKSLVQSSARLLQPADPSPARDHDQGDPCCDASVRNTVPSRALDTERDAKNIGHMAATRLQSLDSFTFEPKAA